MSYRQQYIIHDGRVHYSCSSGELQVGRSEGGDRLILWYSRPTKHILRKTKALQSNTNISGSRKDTKERRHGFTQCHQRIHVAIL